MSQFQKHTFWYAPSESRQKWPEQRHLQKILAEFWQKLKACKYMDFVGCLHFMQKWQTSLSLWRPESPVTKCGRSQSGHLAIIYCVACQVGRADRAYWVFFPEGRGSPLPPVQTWRTQSEHTWYCHKDIQTFWQILGHTCIRGDSLLHCNCTASHHASVMYRGLLSVHTS